MISARSTSDSREGVGRRARADDEPGLAAGLADRRQRVVDVRRRLGVDRDPVGAGLGELGDVALRALDHEVHVEVGLVGQRLAQRGDDHRAERDRRDEVAVHDVAVDDARARVHDLAHLRGEVGEVGGQDRRGDVAFVQRHRALDLPQHRGRARVAGQDRRLGHAHDRRVLAAVGAQRAQLEAVQAVHAAVAARQVGRAAARAPCSSGTVRPIVGHGSSCGQAGDVEAVGAVAVGQHEALGLYSQARCAATCCSFSRGDSVHVE